jgi:hypothetical protein
MAWTSIGSGSTGGKTSDNQASLVHTVGTNNVGIGEVGVIAVVQQNASTLDLFTTSGAVNTVVSTVNDSAGNVWSCAGESNNGATLPGLGVNCSLWWTRATADLPVGGTITASFVSGSSANFDESASSLWVFGVNGPVSALASTSNVVDFSTVLGVIDQTVSTGSNLRFRAIASDSTATNALSTSSGWDSINHSQSGGLIGNSIRGEFIITSASTAASAPTLDVNTLHASVYLVLQETAGDAVGSAVGHATAAAVGVAFSAGDGAGVATGHATAAAVGDSIISGTGVATATATAAADSLGLETGVGEAIGSSVCTGVIAINRAPIWAIIAEPTAPRANTTIF